MVARPQFLVAAVRRDSSVVRCGTGAILAVDHEAKTVAVVPLTCKSRVCPRCRPYKTDIWCKVVRRGAKAADALVSRKAAKRLITKSRRWLLRPPDDPPHTQDPPIEYVYWHGSPRQLHAALDSYLATILEYHQNTGYTKYSYARSPPVRLPPDQGAKDFTWYALALAGGR